MWLQFAIGLSIILAFGVTSACAGIYIAKGVWKKPPTKQEDHNRKEILRLNRALLVLSGINKTMLHVDDEDKLLTAVCEFLTGVGKYRLAWVGMVSRFGAIEPVAHRGFLEGYVPGTHRIRGTSLPSRAIISGKSIVWKNGQPNGSNTMPLATDARSLGYESCAAIPIFQKGDRPLGVLKVYSEHPNAFSAEEIFLLEEIAADIAFGIGAVSMRRDHEIAELRLQKGMAATIDAMAAALELRDSYTAGHQRRVAALSSAIAESLGFSADTMHGIYLAGIVHDIGKIKVPAEILVKPSKLSDLEFRILQQHAEDGYNVLKGLDFPWPLAEIVRQHHERMDGSGYPRGLKGDEILIEARILAVADTVEAMATHRPYRAALGLEAAIAEIKEMSGRTYDSSVVSACESLFKSGKFRFNM
jgi:putative nucleotidyltransferase with HDIG domain